MSIIRMCMVTVSLFRVCMCMCLRARQRERRERSAQAAGMELHPVLDSSNDGCLEKAEQQLRVTTERCQFSEKPFYLSSAPSISHQVANLESILGPFSPKRVLVECKESLQDKFGQTRLRIGLHWLSNNIDECFKEFMNRFENEGAEQAELPEQQHSIISVDSRIPQFTIAWSECDCNMRKESPSCSALQCISEGRQRPEVVGLDKNLKTLEDEFLETEKIPNVAQECLANFEGVCGCNQLPNQIVAGKYCSAGN